MKTIILTTITLLSTVLLSAQASSVEPSTFGLQIGVFGAWAYYETKISDPVALRLEVGTQAMHWVLRLVPVQKISLYLSLLRSL